MNMFLYRSPGNLAMYGTALCDNVNFQTWEKKSERLKITPPLSLHMFILNGKSAQKVKLNRSF